MLQLFQPVNHIPYLGDRVFRHPGIFDSEVQDLQVPDLSDGLDDVQKSRVLNLSVGYGESNLF